MTTHHSVTNLRRSLSALVLGLLLSTSAVAEAPAKTWSTATVDEGRISVRYAVTEMTDAQGETLPLIEYTVTTTDTVSLKDCVAVFKDVNNHTTLGIADKAKAISATDTDALLYYGLEAPWPLPNTDIVVRMTFSEDEAGTAVFTQSAAPKAYPDQGVRRFNHYDMRYRFKDVGNGKTEVTLVASMSPGIPVPLFLLKAGVPDTAAKVIRNLVRLAHH